MARSSLLALAASLSAGALAQEQVHISFTGAGGEMGFDYVTNATCASNQGVSWGTSPSRLVNFQPDTSCFYFQQALRYMHQARVTGLQAGATYFYSVGGGAAGSSPVFNFTMQDLKQTSTPHTVAVLADFGLENGLSLDKLVAEAGNAFDFVLHAGDFAYDMDQDGGRVGNGFMNAIQPIAAHVPYMGCAGNHEVGSNFTQYRNRFGAIANFTAPAAGSPSNHFYSFNVGLVHYVLMDTEVYDEWQGPDLPANMLAWLKKDLRAVDRSVTPWVLAAGHKAHYMSGNSSKWEQIFYDMGVDVFFAGHVHSYDRFAPWNPYTNAYNSSSLSNNATLYTNPAEVVTFVTGATGCREVVVPGCRYDEHNTNMAHCGNYGYGYVTVHNATHLQWVWETASANGAGADPNWRDEAWVVQEHHGKRIPTRA